MTEGLRDLDLDEETDKEVTDALEGEVTAGKAVRLDLEAAPLDEVGDEVLLGGKTSLESVVALLTDLGGGLLALVRCDDWMGGGKDMPFPGCRSRPDR